MTRALLALMLSGCTIGGLGAGAGVTAIHNAEVDHSADKWGYGWPLAIGALVGLGIDILLLKELQNMWSKPMT